MELVVEDVRAESTDFGAWVGPHLTAMARLAARLAPDGDRDDIVQDALSRAWRRRSTYDASRGSVQNWLLAIVADQARRARHRMKPRTSFVDAPISLAVREEDLDLERAVRRLPPRQRLAVALHYFVGLPVTDCAVVMGCAEGTVKSTLSDARARLRDELEER